MKEWLVFLTEQTVVAIDLAALLIVIFSSVEALVAGVRTIRSPLSARERREVWLRDARWLVAALTFQLGADIIETSITTDWQAVVRIAAIAAIRTFLNYFLDRDMSDVREKWARGARSSA